MKYTSITKDENVPGQPYWAVCEFMNGDIWYRHHTPEEAIPIIKELIADHQAELVRLEHMLFELEAENDATI